MLTQVIFFVGDRFILLSFIQCNMPKKVAIIYASRRGGTQLFVERLQKELGADHCELFDLKANPSPDIAPGTIRVLGGPVYAGNMLEDVKKYCESHEQALLQCRLALFMCGMNEPAFAEQLKNAFPEKLQQHAFCVKAVGGAFNFERLNWFERFLVKRISGVKKSTVHYLEDNIEVLVSAVKAEMNRP